MIWIRATITVIISRYARIAVMIAAELGIEIDQIPLDSTDALALAMCHAARVLRSGGVPGREL